MRPLGAGPESILPVGVMDSLMRNCASWNDGCSNPGSPIFQILDRCMLPCISYSIWHGDCYDAFSIPSLQPVDWRSPRERTSIGRPPRPRFRFAAGVERPYSSPRNAGSLMTKRIFLGMLTPSSNTALEPITTAMLAGLPEVSAHFSRFKVTEIALSSQALAQFNNDEILRAAELLAHARVDCIGWNGTSSGWLGFDADHRLCEQITAATGIQATTSMLEIGR